MALRVAKSHTCDVKLWEFWVVNRMVAVAECGAFSAKYSLSYLLTILGRPYVVVGTPL